MSITIKRTNCRCIQHTHTQSFYALLDFVQDYPGELVPER